MRIGNPDEVDQRGFTLAELLVAIAIVGLVMAGLLTLLTRGNEAYLTGSNQVEAQAALRAVLERLTQDIRQAGYDPAGAGFPAITNQTPTQFTIQSDWNGSGAVEPQLIVQVSYNVGGVPTNVDRGEQITYTVAGGALARQESAVDAAPQSLLTAVLQASEGGALQPFFEYRDAAGNVTAVAANIREVVVRLQVGVQNQPPAIWQAGKVQVTMSDRIRLRNR